MEEKKKGIFYAVGVGPGDPELLTVKAIRVLKNCPVIIAPCTGAEEKSKSLALQIAAGNLDLSEKEILEVHFPMVRDKKTLMENYRRIAEQIAGILDRGKDSAMVILGDVSIYSTGSYIRELLEHKGYETVMIPGIPSFCAAASVLGISLAEGDESLHVIPAGQADLDAALELDGTKILMKSGKKICDKIEKLKKHGMRMQAVMVADCGLKTQQVFRDLSEVKGDVSYFATICVNSRKDPR